MWQAYDAVSPFGQSRTDQLIGILICVMFNMWKGKDAQPLLLDQVLGLEEELTPEHVTATIKAFRGY